MMNENELSKIIVDAAFHVHQKLAPGLLESVYESVLERTLIKRGLAIKRQDPVRIRFEDMEFEEGFRADLIVNDLVIIEVKAIDRAIAVHKRQLLTDLQLTGKRLGLLINFGEPYFKDGIFRVVNGPPENLLATLKPDSPIPDQ